MGKFSTWIQSPGTGGPGTRDGIRQLGFAFLSEVLDLGAKAVRVDEVQSFTAGEKTQGRANLGLGALATLSTINGSLWSGTDLAVADGGTGSSTPSGARTALGVAIGSDVQAFDAGLQSLAGLAGGANLMPYMTAADVYATTSLTPYARTLLDDADASTALSTLGVSAFMKTLLDDTTAAQARATLEITNVTAEAINTAPALSGANLADGDKLGVYDVSAAGLVSVVISELIAGIFKAGRVIANAEFATATMKWVNAGGQALSHITTALTAPRQVTWPDRDITVGMVLLSKGTIPGTPAVDWAIPAGVRRIVLILCSFSTNGSSVPMIRLKAGGVAETSGYDGSVFIFTSSAGTGSYSTGFSISTGSSAAGVYHLMVEIILQDGNTWLASLVSGYGNTGGGGFGTGSKTLAGVLDGVRLTTPGGTEFPDAGTYAIYAEY